MGVAGVLGLAGCRGGPAVGRKADANAAELGMNIDVTRRCHHERHVLMTYTVIAEC